MSGLANRRNIWRSQASTVPVGISGEGAYGSRAMDAHRADGMSQVHRPPVKLSVVWHQSALTTSCRLSHKSSRSAENAKFASTLILVEGPTELPEICNRELFAGRKVPARS